MSTIYLKTASIEYRVADRVITREYQAGRINAITAQIARALMEFYSAIDLTVTSAIRAASKLECQGMSAYEVRKMRMGGLTYDYVTQFVNR